MVYPMLFRLCPLTMRTQAILLVRDAVLLLDQLWNSGKYSERTVKFELMLCTVQRKDRATGGSRVITWLPL